MNCNVTLGWVCRESTIFGIKNFWLFNPKSEELLLALLCPNLEKIRLDFVFQGNFLFNLKFRIRSDL